MAAPLGLLLAFQRPARREALLAAVLLGYAAWSAVGPGSGFARFEGAWVLVLAGSVVLTLALRPPGRFGLTASGLLAVGIAAITALVLFGLTSFSFGELRFLAEKHFGQQARLVLGMLYQSLGAAGEGNAALTDLDTISSQVVQTVGRLLPSLVLLQSLFALALAWSLYLALARHPEGEPLPPLRAFRFNDHLVWGIVLAVIALVWPGAGVLRDVGGNFLTFFGGLYVLRGAGIIATLAAAAGFAGPVAGLVAAFFTVFLLPVALLGAMALGVTDTWFDWRRLAQKAKIG